MKKISNLARKIGSNLGEYFLGTQTHKRFEYEKSFLKAHVIESKSYNLMKEVLKREEILNFINGKALPNIMAVVGAGLTVSLRNPYCLFISAFGEYMRSMENKIYNIKFEKRQEERRDHLEIILRKEQEEEERNKRFEGLVEEHDEGDEWKIGTDYE
tara:strand:+ start:5141 stop:5611 length:471 start_codon:yes stop_codon:yes gene_type:complete